MNLPTFSVAKRTEKSIDFSKVFIFGPSVIAIVASFFIAILVVWPKFNQALTLKEGNKTLAETASNLEQKADALSKLDKVKLKSQLSAAEQLLPSEKNIFTFIRQVENVRNSSGVVITNLSVGTVGQFKAAETGGRQEAQTGAAAVGTSAAVPPPAEPNSEEQAGVSVVTMKVSVSSDFNQIFQFLNELYALPRVTTIKELSFAIDQQSSQLTTSLDINSLWQPLPTEMASVEAPLASLDQSDVDLLAKVESTGAVSSPVVVPDVPKGKSNIFSVN